MSSQRLSNHFSACRLISFAKVKMAAEFPGRDTNGPYAILQQAYDPADRAMRPAEFLLGRSGAWLATHWFLRLPVEERRKEFIFPTVGEVMELMQELNGPVRVINAKPPGVREDAPVDPELEQALHGGA
jgi:hypothetical protein